MSKPTCENCPFWEYVDSDPDSQGICRRSFPRLPTMESQTEFFDIESYEGVWPWTRGEDWCGEHPEFMKWMTAINSSIDEDKE